MCQSKLIGGNSHRSRSLKPCDVPVPSAVPSAVPRHITDSQMARIHMGIGPTEVSLLKTPEVAKLRAQGVPHVPLLDGSPWDAAGAGAGDPCM